MFVETELSAGKLCDVGFDLPIAANALFSVLLVRRFGSSKPHFNGPLLGTLETRLEARIISRNHRISLHALIFIIFISWFFMHGFGCGQSGIEFG